MRKSIPIVSLIILIVGGYLAYWLLDNQDQNASPPITPILVQVATVKTQAIPNTIEAVGTIYADQAVELSAQISGQVEKILVNQGESVKEGTPIIRLDDAIYRANLQSSEADLELSRLNYERAKRLEKVKALAKQQLDQMEAEFKEKEATVAVNKALLAKTIITAPFSGILGAKQINIGQYVAVGQSLISLVDTKHLKVTYAIAEKYIPEIKLGQKVVLHTDNYPHQEFTGKVIFISPAIALGTRSVEVQAEVDNTRKSLKLKPGQFVKVTQIINVDQQAVVIPQESLLPSIEGQRAYVVENNRARAVSVKVGARFNDEVAVLAGLKPGNVIVVAGQQNLKDGALVKEANPP